MLFSQDVNGQNYIPKLELIRNAQIELVEDMDNGILTREQGWEIYNSIGFSLVEFEKQIVQDIEELMQGENFVSARRNIALFESMIEILHPEDSVLRGYVADLRSELESLETDVDENQQSINYACKETKDGEPELQDIEGATYLVCTDQSRDAQLAIDKARFSLITYARDNEISINLHVQRQNLTRSDNIYRGTVAVGLN